MTTRRQALTELSFFYAAGALILFLAAAALGRLSVQSLRDVVTAERRVAEAETADAGDAEGTQVFPAPDATSPMAAADAGPGQPFAAPPPYSPPPDISNE